MRKYKPLNKLSPCYHGISSYNNMVQSYRQRVLPRVERTDIRQSQMIHQNYGAEWKEHMDQRRQGIRSTQASHDQPSPDHIEEQEQAPTNATMNMVFMTLVDVEGRLFTDQTCNFPVTSNRGINCIVVFYSVDANYIKLYPTKTCHRTEILRAYTEVYRFLRIRDYRP